MAVYVGVAEAAHALALERAHRKQDDPQTAYLIGEMTNALVTAQMALQGMIAITDNYDFEPVDATANAIFIRKTILARAAITTVEKAMEVVGGSSFYRNVGLERLFRDVQGGLYHPLHEKRQHLFTGRMALGLEPVGNRMGKSIVRWRCSAISSTDSSSGTGRAALLRLNASECRRAPSGLPERVESRLSIPPVLAHRLSTDHRAFTLQVSWLCWAHPSGTTE